MLILAYHPETTCIQRPRCHVLMAVISIMISNKRPLFLAWSLNTGLTVASYLLLTIISIIITVVLEMFNNFLIIIGHGFLIFAYNLVPTVLNTQ